jgi:hypothetical protein
MATGFRYNEPAMQHRHVQGVCSQIRYMRSLNSSRDENTPPIYTEQEIDELYRSIPFVFSTEEMPVEDSPFFPKTKRPPIFVKCPKCGRNLHYSVCDAEIGCYSCQGGG